MTITVRASSLTNWLDCPRRAALQIFKEDIVAAGYELASTNQNIGAAVGSGVHAGSMWRAENKMIGAVINDKTEKSDALDRAVDAFNKQTENGVMFDMVTPDRNTAIKQVVRQLDSYNEHILPSIMPSLVETRLNAQHGDGLIITGQPDIIQDIGSGKIVRDLKAGKFSGYHGAQVGAYSLLARAHGDNISGIIVDHVPRVDMRKPQPAPTSTEYNTALCEKLSVSVLGDIESRHKSFMHGKDIEVFFPNPSSILCSKKFCQAYGTNACQHCKGK